MASFGPHFPVPGSIYSMASMLNVVPSGTALLLSVVRHS